MRVRIFDKESLKWKTEELPESPNLIDDKIMSLSDLDDQLGDMAGDFHKAIVEILNVMSAMNADDYYFWYNYYNFESENN